MSAPVIVLAVGISIFIVAGGVAASSLGTHDFTRDPETKRRSGRTLNAACGWCSVGIGIAFVGLLMWTSAHPA